VRYRAAPRPEKYPAGSGVPGRRGSNLQTALQFPLIPEPKHGEG